MTVVAQSEYQFWFAQYHRKSPGETSRWYIDDAGEARSLWAESCFERLLPIRLGDIELISVPYGFDQLQIG
jgi:hypothetical protein